jgi:hypothetical protein
MTKREQYGLIFNKRDVFPNRISHFIEAREVGPYSFLTFINALDKDGLTDFIDDLNRCLESKENVDEGFFSDRVEHMGAILYKYPNVVINDLVILTIPMEDMRALLQEWVEFIS